MMIAILIIILITVINFAGVSVKTATAIITL